MVKRWYTTKWDSKTSIHLLPAYSCTFQVKTSIIFCTWVILLCMIDHSITVCCLAFTFYIPFLYFLLFAYIYSCRQNRILQYMHVICTCTIIYGWDKTISVEKKNLTTLTFSTSTKTLHCFPRIHIIWLAAINWKANKQI